VAEDLLDDPEILNRRQHGHPAPSAAGKNLGTQ
jgi:hypothetical protein